MNLVSIVVPTFGRANLLARALESIVSQTYMNIEIIVVDDNPVGSLDSENTCSVLDGFLKRIPSMKYVKTLNPSGGGSARNVGISAADGRYVGFLDDDDEFVPEKIERQLGVFKSSELGRLAIVYCPMTIYSEEYNNFIGVTNRLYRGREQPLNKNVYGCIAGTPTMLIASEALTDAGGFRNIRSGQDWALIYDILRIGYEIDFCNESLVNVYVREEGRLSTGKNKVNSLKEEILEIKHEMIVELGLQEEKDKILAHHYYQIASALKFDEKRESVSWLLRSVRLRLGLRETLKFLVGFILGQKITNRIKNNVSYSDKR